jgi:acyl carrier protein phosphodiesterase
MLGNFIADKLPVQEYRQLPAEIQQGVDLHRRIDKYTDTHPSFKSATEILRLNHGKYAPVVLDILNDYLLAQNWHRFTEITFAQFEERVYISFSEQLHHLSGKAHTHVDTLLKYRYLQAYRLREGMLDVLRRMDLRTTFPSNFQSGLDDLENDYATFNLLFLELMTDLIDHVKRNDQPSK